MKLSPVLILTGPTASGKTKNSLLIAKELARVEIVNFDSLLFYKELNIGTAKPSQEEQDGVPHHLVGTNSIKEPMNASLFCQQASSIISKIHEENKIPLLVGGSAFYIRALVKGMYEAQEVPREIKNQISLIEKEHGYIGLRRKLQELDENSYQQIHENDVYRSTRALEHILNTGQKFSELKEKFDRNDPYDLAQCQYKHWHIHHMYLYMEKDEHWPIMKQRANQMIQDGLIEEVHNILSSGLGPELKPLGSIGYKETLAYIKSQTEQRAMTKDELIENIFISTRRLAKSQKTFFKKMTPKKVYHPINQADTILEEVKDFLRPF